jgi:hypothetical protein
MMEPSQIIVRIMSRRRSRRLHHAVTVTPGRQRQQRTITDMNTDSHVVMLHTTVGAVK